MSSSPPSMRRLSLDDDHQVKLHGVALDLVARFMLDTDIKSLLSFQRSSRVAYDIATPLIYRRIILNSKTRYVKLFRTASLLDAEPLTVHNDDDAHANTRARSRIDLAFRLTEHLVVVDAPPDRNMLMRLNYALLGLSPASGPPISPTALRFSNLKALELWSSELISMFDVHGFPSVPIGYDLCVYDSRPGGEVFGRPARQPWKGRFSNVFVHPYDSDFELSYFIDSSTSIHVVARFAEEEDNQDILESIERSFARTTSTASTWTFYLSNTVELPTVSVQIDYEYERESLSDPEVIDSVERVGRFKDEGKKEEYWLALLEHRVTDVGHVDIGAFRKMIEEKRLRFVFLDDGDPQKICKICGDSWSFLY